jgi:type III secretory pathway component EscT
VTPTAELPGIARAFLEVGACSLRLLPVVALSPFLGGPLLPPAGRAGLALCLGAVVRASLGATIPGGASVPGLVLSELLLGIVLAVAATLPLEAARGAGRLVDTLRGATLAELHVAPIRQRESALGDLLAQWTVPLAGWTGADRLLVASLLATFRAFPLGVLPGGGRSLAAIAGAGTELLSAGLCIGAPAAAGLLVADLALAVSSRISPRSGAGDAAPALRATLGIALVALPSAAIAGRLVELCALPGAIVAGLAGGSP